MEVNEVTASQILASWIMVQMSLGFLKFKAWREIRDDLVCLRLLFFNHSWKTRVQRDEMMSAKMTWLVKGRGKNTDEIQWTQSSFDFLTYSEILLDLPQSCKNSTEFICSASSSVNILYNHGFIQNAYINITTILLTIDFRFHQFSTSVLLLFQIEFTISHSTSLLTYHTAFGL